MSESSPPNTVIFQGFWHGTPQFGFQVLPGCEDLKPVRPNPSDSGIDLFLAEDYVLGPGQRIKARTGVKFDLPVVLDPDGGILFHVGLNCRGRSSSFLNDHAMVPKTITPRGPAPASGWTQAGAPELVPAASTGRPARLDIFNGTIDNTFGRELMVGIHNADDREVFLKRGMRMGQFVPELILPFELVECAHVEERRQGWGSSGHADFQPAGTTTDRIVLDEPNIKESPRIDEAVKNSRAGRRASKQEVAEVFGEPGNPGE